MNLGFSEKNWNVLEFPDKSVIQAIENEENRFIDTIINDTFNYKDDFIKAKYISKVLVGFQYMSIKDIEDSVREKAFLFTSIYLKKLFEYIDFQSWKKYNAHNWLGVISKLTSKDGVIQDFAINCSNFSDEQKYFLILGDNWTDSEFLKYLIRIRWSGIVSFSTFQKSGILMDNIKSIRLLKDIYLNQKDINETICQSNFYWIYANGLKSIPETVINGFPAWRNEYGTFLNNVANEIGIVNAPDEIMLIIDVNSFARCEKHLNRMLETFDSLDYIKVNVSILNNSKPSRQIEQDNFQRLEINEYDLSLAELAFYCEQNIREQHLSKVMIPHVNNKVGVPLEADDETYINDYITLINEFILEKEGILKYTDKINFYTGELISCTAISENLHIRRTKTENHLEQVIQKSTAEHNQNIIHIPHTPGAGASVLCRSVCWRLKNEFPTIIQMSDTNDNVMECYRRLSSLSGKHLLILMDNDYSQNDVQLLYNMLKNRKIKCVILYPMRHYSEIKNEEFNLSVLSVNEGLEFGDMYKAKMRDIKNYGSEEIERREKNLYDLSTDLNLDKFRLPFFYGMYAFEDDFIGVVQYVDSVFDKMKDNSKYAIAINYIALITYYTSEWGLS